MYQRRKDKGRHGVPASHRGAPGNPVTGTLAACVPLLVTSISWTSRAGAWNGAYLHEEGYTVNAFNPGNTFRHSFC